MVSNGPLTLKALKIYAIAWKIRTQREIINLQLVYANLVVPNIPTRLEDKELEILNSPCLERI